MSAFFILLSADNEGNSADSSVDTTLVLVSSDELEPPNNLEKKPFFVLSLLSLIMFA